MDVAEEDNAQLKKRQAIQVIMSDTSLSPQEKQKKIQEFMTSGSQVTAPIPPSATQYSAAPTPDVVRDAVTLGHRQPGVTAAAGNPRPPPATTASAPTRQSPEVGAIQSSGMDPASRKGSRVSSNREASTPGAIRSESNKADQISTRIGAVSSLADHAAARKGGRVPSSMSVSAAADAVSIEPDALAPPSIGAVSSSGEDPATRKGARGTPRTSVRASVTGSINSADAQSVGASSAGHHEDPATRKTVRASRTPMQFTGSSLSRAGSGKTKEISDSEAERMPNSGIPAAAAAAAPIYDESRQMKEIGELESEYVSKSPVAVPPSSLPIPMATLPTVPPSHTTAAADGRTMIPVQEEHQDQYEQSNSLPSPAQQPETYAGVGLVGPDVAGADTGGIQAYVAGGDLEVVIGATEVVTEDAIAEEEKKKQTRLLRIGGVSLCVLLLAIVIPVAILVSGEEEVVEITDPPSNAPSASPTSAVFADLLDALQPLYPDEDVFDAAFSTRDTPQYRAADWAANSAPLTLEGSDPRMISRYALATFYFATNGDDWESCGVKSTSCDEGREWLTAENECDWLAIVCEDPVGGDYSVRELFFPPIGITGNNIAGTLPFEVALLSNLNRIVLSKQSLQGSIPETWSQLTNLETLIIGTNQLTGTFPDFLFSPNTLLGTLYLSMNKIAGQLPALSSSALKGLRIDQNMFSGSIPTEFGGLGALQELFVNNNDLTGNVPEELYTLSSLRTLTLGNNTRLTGTIPESIANLQSLAQLRIVNTNMAGPLPAGLFDLVNLQVLELSGNSFSGSLSVNFANFSNVTHIQLSNNTFTGTIPDVFQGLEFLRNLELHRNGFTGEISAGLCNRTGDSFFDINYLTADCLGSSPEVLCSCCSECF